jgi:ribosomal protein S18 acetylase RimI-like enzyme
LEKAALLSHLVKSVYIEYMPQTLQIGLVYVADAFRGRNLVKLLIDEKIRQTKMANPDVGEVHIQVFRGNVPAIKAYEKAGFVIAESRKSPTDEVAEYLPSSEKVLMKKEIN